MATHRETADGIERIVAYTVGIEHQVNGAPVVGDGIALIVDSDGVGLLSTFWHDISIAKEARAQELPPFGPQALQECARRLKSRHDALSEMPDVLSVRPAYYVGDIVGKTAGPARMVWEIWFKGGKRELWDPSASDVVDQMADYILQRGIRAER